MSSLSFYYYFPPLFFLNQSLCAIGSTAERQWVSTGKIQQREMRSCAEWLMAEEQNRVQAKTEIKTLVLVALKLCEHFLRAKHHVQLVNGFWCESRGCREAFG